VTVVGVLGLLLGVLAIGIGRSQATSSRLVVCAALFAAHLAASLYYYQYSMTASADAWSYYFDPMSLSSSPFSLGMIFVFKLVHFMKATTEATYLDCFFVFQSIGFAGNMILLRVFDEIGANIGVPENRGYFVLLFLPSVNFWTGAIGKDAPLFFAVSLCVWAMLSLRRRIVYFCLALFVMILFRAHIALMAATALALSAFIGSTASLGRKAGMLVIAIAGLWFTIGPVENTLNVDVTSVDAVSTFLDSKNSGFATVAGTTSLGHASFPVRVFSLIFRPFFFDAGNILGVVASIENVGVALALLYLIAHARDLMMLIRRVLFIRFCLLFAIVILFSLTLVYYNVGLGLRQRVMAFPMIFPVLVAMWSLRRRQAAAEAGRVQQGLVPGPLRNRPLPEV